MEEKLRLDRKIKRWWFLPILLLMIAVWLEACNNLKEEEPTTISAEKFLTVYTPHKKEIYAPIIKEFEERTGIWVNVETGGTSQLLERIKSEAGVPGCDVMFGGGVESLEAYKEYFQSYKSPQTEQVPANFYAKDYCWSGFSALPIVFIYNKKLVSDLNLPDSWKSLTDPCWKGRIAYVSPEISGSCYTALVTMMSASEDAEGWQMVEEFIQNLDGQLLESSEEICQSVAKGIYIVGITLEESAKKQVNLGEDVAFLYPEEGTSFVPDGSAIIKNCPHEEYARLFIDFTLSKAAQEYLTTELNRRSIRTDVKPPEGLPLLGEIKQINYDISWAAKNNGEIIRHWKELAKGSEK